MVFPIKQMYIDSTRSLLSSDKKRILIILGSFNTRLKTKKWGQTYDSHCICDMCKKKRQKENERKIPTEWKYCLRYISS